MPDRVKLTEPALELLRELDEHKPPLIQWMSGYGYGATDAGRALLASEKGK